MRLDSKPRRAPPLELIAVATLLLATVMATARQARAAFPTGANGLITFTSNRDGAQSVFTMGFDGSNPINLHQGHNAVFSPDGTRIAFRTHDGPDEDVFVMGADGSGATNLTSGFAGDDDSPAFSPDGTQIAYARGSDIYVMGADGSNPLNLTPGAASGDEPSYSPDGTQIVFTRFDLGDFDIYAMGADGSNPVNLTSTSPASDTSPSFSPDGTKITFASDRDGGDFDVFTMASDGSIPTNLTVGSTATDGRPTYSPDGTRIAFDSTREGGTDVFAIGADGTNPVNLTGRADPDSDFAPDWQRLEPVDTDPPETKIEKGPKKTTEKRKAKFGFSSDEPVSTFQCKLDRKDFEPCDASEKFKVKPDEHKLEVQAVDLAGNVDPTPAKRRWEVRRDQG